MDWWQRVGKKPTIARHPEGETLVKRTVLQDRVAERAAEIARHADEIGDADTADILWRVVRRSRVQTLKLRVVGATSCSSAR